MRSLHDASSGSRNSAGLFRETLQWCGYFIVLVRRSFESRSCRSHHKLFSNGSENGDQYQFASFFFISKEAEACRLPNWNYSKRRIEACTSSYRGTMTKLILKLETLYTCKRRPTTCGAKVRNDINFVSSNVSNSSHRDNRCSLPLI